VARHTTHKAAPPDGRGAARCGAARRGAGGQVTERPAHWVYVRKSARRALIGPLDVRNSALPQQRAGGPFRFADFMSKNGRNSARRNGQCQKVGISAGRRPVVARGGCQKVGKA